MEAKVRVALDAMGGDYAPSATVQGAVEAAREYGIGIQLVGHEEQIRAELARYDIGGLDLAITHTDEVIAMDEHPATAVRRKKNASLVLALELARSGQVVGAVSAGNSGAMMAASLFVLKRIAGVDRPALGTVMPTRTGTTLVLDVGANTDCKPEYLQQFALMGAVYMERLFRINRPRVALLANGEEETKGNQQVQEAHHLLKESAPRLGLNFIGNIEGRDIPAGAAEVVVCDGFVGNVVLKLSEGLAETLIAMLRSQMTSNPVNTLAAAVLKPSLKQLFKRLDYAEYGGVPLLGVNGVAVIAHGRSNAKAIKNALRVARETAEQGVVTAIAEGLARLGTGGEQRAEAEV